MKQKLKINPITVGYDDNKIPIKIYLDDGYRNYNLEIAVNSKDWKVYFYGVPIGYVDDEGSVCIYDGDN